MNPLSLAPFIDHTLLRAAATRPDIEILCREAVEHQFHAVCVNPVRLALARECLAESPVQLCAVVGFPLGASLTESKVLETQFCLDQGAHEIDMVMNIGAAHEGEWNVVMDDIHAVAEAKGDALLKVILETCDLSHEQIVEACKRAVQSGADFVKTSTVFGSAGATVEHIRLMRQTVGPTVGVKAAGGIKDHVTALAMIKAGATRLGTSSSVAIVLGGKSEHGY